MPDQVRHDSNKRIKDREQLDNGRKLVWAFEKVEEMKTKKAVAMQQPCIKIYVELTSAR
jgi:hypothetical protein